MSLNKRFWGLKYQNGNKKEFIPESIRIKKADVQKVKDSMIKITIPRYGENFDETLKIIRIRLSEIQK